MNPEDSTRKDQIVEVARATILAEAEAMRVVAGRLDGKIAEATELILAARGKVVVTGMGKSGHIGQKIAATLCSTGTPAVFLHAAEATHGDLGIYEPGDPSILISKSGATAELVHLIPVLRQFKTPLIGILGNLASPMALSVDVALDARVAREADPLNLAPTSSSSVALALGDALASALMYARKFSTEDFARFHPSGQLGRTLSLTVDDLMHDGSEVAWVGPDAALRDVVIAMTQHPLGAACVIDNDRCLLGIITDGDLRRALQAHDDIRTLRASEIMTAHPITITPTTTLKEATRLMEDRPSQISVVPVVGEAMECLGLLRIHDLYQPDLA
ncbi:MAG TPA: KpsF/GutQ family sugar-phosphate isomerase [Bacteroidota bacterium]|nr:KpsF/GutQ family sugar-phosphate isomerase [Bacteroidota bacterium]